MVNIYKSKLTLLQSAILRLFFVRAGKLLNQHEIANVIEVSQPAVMKSIDGLKSEHLLNVNQDEKSKRWFIELNRDNHKVLQLKRADNLKLIYESGLGDFLEKEFAGATVVLFGSYSRGDDTLNSDIDIAIVGRKHKDIEFIKFERVLERKININFYASFKGIHKNLRENIFNGIVLFGGVEL